MRIAVISVHGCPCIQPGGTDAGGMNVYVDQVARRLGRLGDAVVVYSRTHSGIENEIESLGYQLVHVPVGEITLPKDRIPETLSDFTTAVESDAVVNNRTFDLVTSHYWLSGVVGRELGRSWTVPHVTSFHTLASIKKRVRPEEDEPKIRFVNEARVARESDVVIAWTEGEAEHITREFNMPVDKIAIVPARCRHGTLRIVANLFGYASHKTYFVRR